MNSGTSGPIRLALCITELGIGGAERSFVELANRLDRTRFAPVVYCLGPEPTGNRAMLVEELARAGTPYHCLGARSKLQLFSVEAHLTRLLREQTPHIAQSFLFHANVVTAVAARRANVPRVLAGIRVAERRRNWHVTVQRWLAPAVDRFVCVSQAVAEFSRTTGGLPDEKLTVIPNGVDLARFEAARPVQLDSLSLASNTRLLTYVGRLDPQKGLKWLLDLMPDVFRRLPGHDLLLVGQGRQGRRLERYARRRRIDDRVHFAGFRSDVPEILAASDLLLLPSRWEGMPNAVLEAMAAAKPVVACNVEGVAELLGPATPTQTVDDFDAQAFADKIVAIANNPALQAELGLQNRRRAGQHFSLAAVVKAYEQLYESVTAG